MQVAMRAPKRDTHSVVLEGFSYPVNENGVAIVHTNHVPAAKSLGFKPCSEESPDAPAVSSLSEKDWAAFQAFKASQPAESKAEPAPTTILDMKPSTSAPAAQPPKK